MMTYDEEIEYVIENRGKLRDIWNNLDSNGLKIFKCCGPRHSLIGCPTMIKEDFISRNPRPFVAINDEITKAIQQDPIIPANINELDNLSDEEMRRVLKRFKYYQQWTDAAMEWAKVKETTHAN